jgi:hypothetical protein
MSTYKITNITNTLGKRELKNNSILTVDYVDGITKKSLNIKPGEFVYLTVPTLPLSVHRLRVKNLITVIEVSQSDLSAMIEISLPKINNVVNNVNEKIEEPPKTNIKKREVRKETE